MVRIARISRWPLALFVALVALAMSFGPAAAAPATPTRPDRAAQALERTYKEQRQRLALQDARLKLAVAHAAKIDALIAKLKGKGQDTAALEQAVAAYRAGIDGARAEWQSASATLAAHAGFDASGKVTDTVQARATLSDAHGHMQQVHTIMAGAYRTLHAAVVAYRKAHRGVQEPVAPPAP